MMEELKNRPPAEIPADAEETGERASLAPEYHIDLPEVRRLRMEAKKQVVVETQRAGEDFWALRFPTWRGIKKAARNTLCAPFNLVAAPLAAARRHMWRQSFFEAVRQGDRTLANEALEAGVDVAADKNCAFLTAVYNNDVEMARLLYTHGADINAHHGLPLMLAVVRGHTEMTQCLLCDLKTNPETRIFAKMAGTDELSIAGMMMGGDVERALLDAGIRPERRIMAVNCTEFLMNDVRTREMRCGTMVLPDGGVIRLDPAKAPAASVAGQRELPDLSPERLWRGVLIAAAQDKNVELVREALDAGVSPDVSGGLVSVIAAYNNDVEMLRLLHLRGADADAGNGLPLVMAVLKGNVEAAGCILHELKGSIDTRVFSKGMDSGGEIAFVMSWLSAYSRPTKMHGVLARAGVSFQSRGLSGVYVGNKAGFAARLARMGAGRLEGDGWAFDIDPSKKDVIDALTEESVAKRLGFPAPRPR